MYSEKAYKNYIFWIQVKRVFLIILFTSIGAGIGLLVGKILESTIKFYFTNYIIAGCATFLFFFSLLITASTGKEVQDGYWKIAVMRKLTVIQKDIEINNELALKGARTSATTVKSLDAIKGIVDNIPQKMKDLKQEIKTGEEIDDDEDANPIIEEKEPKNQEVNLKISKKQKPKIKNIKKTETRIVKPKSPEIKVKEEPKEVEKSINN